MVKSNQGWGCRFILAACAMSGAIALSANRALAQVTPDGTLGTQVDNFVITNGTTIGNNLFHSFGSFSVPTGQTASFNNATNIVNIFGRVTGGAGSNIDGTIQAQGTANLFLMNPNGIIFGPNSRLDIGGSFVGTTANAIRFPGGGEFSMNSPVVPGNNLLAINPSALFFNQTPAGAIVNQSKVGLQVQPGKNLFLVGGEVRLENGGTVRAPGGRIELGGLAGVGEIKIEEITTGSNPNLDFPAVGLTFPEGVARADVIFTNGAIADVTGENGGDIAINARNLLLSGQSNICAGLGSNIDCGGVDGQPGGTSTSKAGNIVIDTTGEVKLSQLSRIANNVNENATGNNDADIFQTIKTADDIGDPSLIFGSIFITANSLSVTDGASVSTSTFGNGNAGLLYVEAKDSVSVSGYQPIPGVSDPSDPSTFSRSRLASSVGEGATGNAGGVFIQTGSLSLTNYSFITSSTSGNGNAGAVIVEASGAVSLANDSIIFNNVEAGGNGGDSGVIDITAESLSLTNGSQLQTIARDVNQGNAGSVTINVRDAVTISGEGNPAFGNQGNALPSAIFSTVNPGVSGNAGNVEISARSIALSNSGKINTDLYGTGTPGSIFLEATDSISLTNGATIQSVIGQGAVATSGDNPFSDEFSDSSDSFDDRTTGGKTGTILISTGGLSIDNSLITASTQGQGDAGSVIVAADGKVSLTNGGLIRSRVDSTGTGNAGGIFMAVESLTIEGTPDNGSGMATSAFGTGQGNPGFIFVFAEKDITIKSGADEDVPIEDEARSGIYSRVGEETVNSDTNDSGILLTAESIFIKDGGVLNVDNKGIGEAGDIVILTRDLILNNQGKITAASASGTGGEILIAGDLIVNNQGQDTDASTSGTGGTPVLIPGDFVLLLRNSEISTLAGTADRPAAENGGDITISSRYLISAPFSSNDLDARAFGIKGGRIEITADRLYDIEQRPLSDLSNDISTTSGFGEPGVVTSNVLNADPTQGIGNLPTDPVDPSTLISEACAPRGGLTERPNNQFIVTGRGGLPPDPNAAFTGEAEVNELDTPNVGEENTTGGPNSTNPTSPTLVASTSRQKPEIVEAQGWVYGENGDIIFTAQAPNVTSTTPTLTPASTCNVSSTSSK